MMILISNLIIGGVLIFFYYQYKQMSKEDQTFPLKNKINRLERLNLLLILIPLSWVFYIEYAPHYINSAADFNRIQNNPSGHYIITKNLDFKNRKDITSYTNWCQESFYFDGTLDGNHKTITNVNQPLFECTLNNSIIKDLNLTNVSIKAKYTDQTGVITNENKGLIDNVHVEGTVKGYINTGGLAGKHDDGMIQNSSFVGVVEGLDKVGGIAGSGYNGGSIYRTYVKGTVIGEDEVGGLFGNPASYYDAFIEESYMTGTVKGKQRVGGIAGFSQTPIINSYANTTIISSDWASGGIAGQNWRSIQNSFSLGQINGGYRVGGIAGEGSDSTVENIFSCSKISGESNTVYDITGTFDGGEPFTITNSYVYENQTINGELTTSDVKVTQDQLLNPNWYKDVLKYDETIWDLSVVEKGYFPILKHVPNQDLIPIVGENDE